MIKKPCIHICSRSILSKKLRIAEEGIPRLSGEGANENNLLSVIGLYAPFVIITLLYSSSGVIFLHIYSAAAYEIVCRRKNLVLKSSFYILQADIHIE
jgi:hypothetical protein